MSEEKTHPPKMDAKTGQTKIQSRNEKKSRRSGLRTNKPYISSSMGAMTRHMMRMALTEQTVGMTVPPPVDFFTFWRTFNLGGQNDYPPDFVDLEKVSIAKLKPRTSSFDFYGSEVSSINSANALDIDSDDSDKKKKKDLPQIDDVTKKKETVDENGMMSDNWGKFMRSYSNESLVSNSTKSDSLYEPELGEGFSDYMEDDNTDSDAELLQNMKLQFGLLQGVPSLKSESQVSVSVRGDEEKEKMRAKSKAKDAALAIAKLEQDRVIQQEAEEKARKEAAYDRLIRSGSHDSFLRDDFSYAELSDSVFDSDFDFFNERSSDEAFSSGEEAELEARKNKKRPKSCKLHPKLDPAVIAAQKAQIEDRLREAAQCRSAMGTYIPPKGGKPLTTYFDSSSPGPAAYYPGLKLTMGALLTSRWKKNNYESLGPGPGAYYAEKDQHTIQMYNLHEGDRFEKSSTLGPGPGVVNISPAGKTGKDRPHAIIFSRRPTQKVGCGNGAYTNCQGFTRRGKANPHNAIIISRHPSKDKSVPGPGAYDTPELPDSRVGIILKSRIPALGPGMEPGYLMLPDVMGDGPAFSFGTKNWKTINNDSPGPIYKIPLPKKKPISLTFKPFPVRGSESEPGPSHYGNAAEKGKIKTLPKAPVAVLTGRQFPNFGQDQLPGPNHYNIQQDLGAEGPSMTGRKKTKTSVEPGPADYVPNNKHLRKAARPVFQHRYKDKALKENSPGFVYSPKYQNRVLGGQLYGRWKTGEIPEKAPELLNLSGYTRYGPQSKIPISLRSRQTHFKHNLI